MSTIIKVADLVSKNSFCKNYFIERIDKKHQLSGLRSLRKLKELFYHRYTKGHPYIFDRKTNMYIFSKKFQNFCGSFVKYKMKKQSKKINKNRG